MVNRSEDRFPSILLNITDTKLRNQPAEERDGQRKEHEHGGRETDGLRQQPQQERQRNEAEERGDRLHRAGAATDACQGTRFADRMAQRKLKRDVDLACVNV